MCVKAKKCRLAKKIANPCAQCALKPNNMHIYSTILCKVFPYVMI